MPAVIPYVGSCGETSERAAARAHKAITIFYAVALIGEIGVVITKALMLAWHYNGIGTHERRAVERGES